MKFREQTHDSEVQTCPICELINRLEMFKSCQHGDLSIAEMFADRVVNIPSGYRKSIRGGVRKLYNIRIISCNFSDNCNAA